jgi:hypothetical protein
LPVIAVHTDVPGLTGIIGDLKPLSFFFVDRGLFGGSLLGQQSRAGGGDQETGERTTARLLKDMLPPGVVGRSIYNLLTFAVKGLSFRGSVGLDIYELDITLGTPFPGRPLALQP